MVHVLLAASMVLFILWIIGLGGAWAPHTAWMLFVAACAMLVIWAIVSLMTDSFGRRHMRDTV